MRKGKIVETGTHDTLLRDFPTGEYAKFVREQESHESKEENEEQMKEEI